MGRMKDYYWNELEHLYDATEVLGEEEYDLAFSELDKEGLIPNPTSKEIDAIWAEYEATVLNCESCDGEGCRKCQK